MALSHVPTFVATLLAGWMSGTLLTHFMPKEGPHYPKTMWLIIGLVRETVIVSGTMAS
jgi:hypothetical protein